MTIKDLDFKAHGAAMGGTHATAEFPNGYGVSVVTGQCFYTDDEHPYELAVMKDGRCCYDTPLTDDVLGHLNARQVNQYLKKIEALPKVKRQAAKK